MREIKVAFVPGPRRPVASVSAMAEAAYRTGENLAGLTDFARRVKKCVQKRPAILEIGSFVGDSANVFIEHLQPSLMTCVDPWNAQMNGYERVDNLYHRILANVKPKARKAGAELRPEQMTSAAYFTKERGKQFDLVYIDAVHEYEAVKADIEGSLKLLAKTGVLSGHDFKPDAFPGLVKAVVETMNEHRDRFERLELFRDTTWALISRS